MPRNPVSLPARLLPAGIRSRLFLLMAMILLPMMLLLGWTYYSRYQDQRAEVLGMETEVAEAVAMAFRAYVDDVRHTNFAVGRALAEHRGDRAEADRLLQDVVSHYDTLRSLHWVSPQGTVVATSMPEALGRDLSRRDYVQGIQAGQEWAIGTLVKSVVGGQPTIVVSTAIRDDRGALVGIVAAAIEPERLGKLTLAHQRQDQGAYAIFDSRGTLVYRNPEVPLTWEQRLRWKDGDALLQRALQSGQPQAAIIDGTFSPGRFLAARVPIPGTGFVAGAGRSDLIALRPVRQGLIQDATWTFAIALMAVLLASWIARSISLPLRRLQDDALLLESGEAVRTRPHPAPREVEHLRRSVESMAATLIRQAATLRHDEERLRRMLDANPIGTLKCTPEGPIVEANEAFLRLVGRSRADLEAGRLRWDEITPSEHLARHVQAVAEAQEKGVSSLVEKEYLRPDGTRVPVLVAFARVDGGRDLVAFVLDISERKEAEAQLHHLAHHDALTGLANRALLQQRLGELIARAQRHGTLVTLLYLDLDHFKPVNDSLGHEVGDALLQSVAQRLLGCVRKTDTVARVGGDEFVVLLDELRDADEAGWLAQNIVDSMARPFHLAHQPIYVSASVGIACYPQDGRTADTLLRHADQAMYKAKEDGKNAYRYFSAGMDRSARERLFLTSGLRRALEHDELALVYQPRIATGTSRVQGVEALVRWNSAEHGLLLPSRFIGIAEETGMIEPIGDWVLKTACAQLAAWNSPGSRHLFLSVNVSARQFGQPKLAERVARILESTGVEPGRLELEITESAVMANPERAGKLLAQLAALGVRLSLDDFGTGHSSLAYLQRFPVRHLKIDRSFVQELPQNRESAGIVKAVVAMAHGLEMGVTAEGVETEAQRHFLEEVGCDAWQGYLCSQPLAAAELEAFLAGEQVSFAEKA